MKWHGGTPDVRHAEYIVGIKCKSKGRKKKKKLYSTETEKIKSF
jgi:hypothetical protein